MSISTAVHDRLLDEYNSGKKQTELAKEHNISQQYICRLLSGKRECGDITLKTLEKMFPNATLNLNGNGITQFANNVRVNHQTVTTEKRVESYRSEALQKIIALDLSGDDLKKVLTALMEVEV
jgi:transcriptional regulator with XRE-family HTH domain